MVEVKSPTTTEEELFGGRRMVTFMIYLSSVEAGGHTIFPQAGISVKPKVGSALYWFNMGAQNNYDSRIRHLGCPVLFGNKWIANKWIKWQANFQNYPCLNERKYWSIYQDHIMNTSKHKSTKYVNSEDTKQSKSIPNFFYFNYPPQ